MKNEIVPSFKNTIFNEDSINLIKERVEITIDSLTDDEIVKAIPIVSTLSAIYKFGLGIKERIFVIETLKFIEGLNSGILNEKTINRHKEMLENNKEMMEKEINLVMAYISNQYGDNQSKRLGKLYAARISQRITWEEFKELSEANKRLFETDYDTLLKVSNGSQTNSDYKADRLCSIGLVTNSNVTKHGNVINVTGSGYKLTNLGFKYLDIVD